MSFRDIINRRNSILLRELVITDFKLRYQGSFLGYLWSVLKPLLLFTILYIVFDKFLKLGRGVEHYPVYLLLGVVLWSFFVETTTQGLMSVIRRGSLIRKINFPKHIIVISGTLSAVINLFINLAVVAVFMYFSGIQFHFSMFLAIPLIIELYIFSLSLAFLLSALNVRYRDIGYLWEILLQAAFYATPIIYPVQMVINSGVMQAKYILINPVAQIIQDMRYVIVTNDSVVTLQIFPIWVYIFIIIIIIIMSFISFLFFNKESDYFAERI